MKVAIPKYTYSKDEFFSISVECEDVNQYSLIQVSIFDAGARNPSERLSVGAAAILTNKNTYEIKLDLENLNPYIYEIKLITFHSNTEIDIASDEIKFVSGRDFERLFFEVIEDSSQQTKSREELNKVVADKETENEDHFLSGIDIRTSRSDEGINYSVFVYLKGVLVGKTIRLDRYQISPYRGLDTKDVIELTNDFLSNKTTTKLQFEYSDNLKNESRQSNPVSIIYFPCVVASKWDQANDYCNYKTSFLLQALSLTRGGSGEIFNSVVVDIKSGSSQMFTPRNPYRGNLSTGDIAGENAETLSNYVNALEGNPFNNFLVNLHKEAIAEKNMNFKYVRYWQILETIAESKNYDENLDLLDFQGNVITNDDCTNRKIKGSAAVVYQLLKDHKKHGNIAELAVHVGRKPLSQWEVVNIWLALRNAVVHHGSVWNYSMLSRESTKAWAKMGIDVLKTDRHDTIVLGDLKEDVKLVLMRVLNNL